MNEIKSFIFYRSYYELIKELPQKQQIELYSAICKNIFEDETIELKGMTGAVFKFILPQLEANKVKYINGCKGGKFGKLGGRPKPQTDENENPEQTQSKTPSITPNVTPPETPSITPNVNDNVNVNVNDNYIRDSKCNRKGYKGETPTPLKDTIKFIKPTLEEVKAYCEERKNNVDAEKFIDHYQTRGWYAGKTKMKDWKACVRTWEKNNYDNVRQNNNAGQNKTDEGILDKWEGLVEYYEEAKNETDGERHNRVFGNS